MDMMVLPFCLMLWTLAGADTWTDLGIVWHLACGWDWFFSMFNVPTTGESGVIAQRLWCPSLC